MTRSSRFMARGDTTAATTARIPICHGARGDGASDHDDQGRLVSHENEASLGNADVFMLKTKLKTPTPARSCR